MTDVFVDEDEWEQLNLELSTIRAEAEKVNAFMVQHGHKKWEVCLSCSIRRTHADLLILQKNGAPVWLNSASLCDKNVLQWLTDTGIKPPALNSIV